MIRHDFITLPDARTYTLGNVRTPACLIEQSRVVENATDSSGSCGIPEWQTCIDGLTTADISVSNGSIVDIRPASTAAADEPAYLDVRDSMLLPAFVDLHTHIDKGHTCERSRNPDGSLTGADRSTAADAELWDADDVFRRMDFSVACAYAHGTAALRTHLINMTPQQRCLTWPAFSKLRDKWAGKVELQGVCLVVLSFFRDAEAAKALADTVAAHNGVLGAAVCCAEDGGKPEDDWTTCEADRGELLDRVFTLAAERGLDLDFHVDENRNVAAKGLRYVAQKALQHAFAGRIVCGHCCSLAWQSDADVALTVRLAAEAGITVVSLPLVNEWTQDRDHRGRRTPRWRGVTALAELADAGVAVALASDNTRDQFYAYGDLDMLEVFAQGCRIGHLDRPAIGAWPRAVTATPAAAMGLAGRGFGSLRVGGPADFVLFRGRRYSELLARPQFDRVVVRGGRAITTGVPGYEQLDFAPLPPPAAALVPNGAMAPRQSDRVLAGEDAVVQQALGVQGAVRDAVQQAHGKEGGGDGGTARNGLLPAVSAAAAAGRVSMAHSSALGPASEPDGNHNKQPRRAASPTQGNA